MPAGPARASGLAGSAHYLLIKALLFDPVARLGEEGAWQSRVSRSGDPRQRAMDAMQVVSHALYGGKQRKKTAHTLALETAGGCATPLIPRHRTLPTVLFAVAKP